MYMQPKKCGSALKAANVVANKLSVLLQNADKHDVRRVEGLYNSSVMLPMC